MTTLSFVLTTSDIIGVIVIEANYSLRNRFVLDAVVSLKNMHIGRLLWGLLAAMKRCVVANAFSLGS